MHTSETDNKGSANVGWADDRDRDRVAIWGGRRDGRNYTCIIFVKY